MMSEIKKGYFAKTLDKGMRVLSLFDQDNPSWSLTEIAEDLNLNLTSAYRLVNTFIELGYLKRGERSKMINLGPMAVALAHQLLHGFDPNRLIEPLVDDYHIRYDISIDVSMFHADYLIQVYNRESAGTLTYHQETVSEKLYCTGAGKSVLAFLPPTEATPLIRRQFYVCCTEKTITTAAALERELGFIRERGYALGNEEYIKGLIAIAAPILSRTNHIPLGAVSFTTTTLEQSLDQFEEAYVPALCELAQKLSEVIPDL